MYKRQVIGKTLSVDRKEPMSIRGVFEDMGENADIHFDVVVPVSYTHLDVYKRQGKLCVIFTTLHTSVASCHDKELTNRTALYLSLIHIFIYLVFCIRKRSYPFAS